MLLRLGWGGVKIRKLPSPHFTAQRLNIFLLKECPLFADPLHSYCSHSALTPSPRHWLSFSPGFYSQVKFYVDNQPCSNKDWHLVTSLNHLRKVPWQLRYRWLLAPFKNKSVCKNQLPKEYSTNLALFQLGRSKSIYLCIEANLVRSTQRVRPPCSPQTL